ncbi:MAG: hypothetical protein ACHBMF_08210 [Chromatiales bacterium]
MLLIDHQSGLFQLVKDIPVPELRRNAIALAKVAMLLKIPDITTASVPDERGFHRTIRNLPLKPPGEKPVLPWGPVADRR